MKRTILATLFFVFGTALVFAGTALTFAGTARAAERLQGPLQGPVTLASMVVVNDDVIRLGDIFTNIGAKATIAVAYAPQPGRRTVLDVVWLAQVARVHRLPWRPKSRFVRTTVERASRVIGRERVVEEIKTALRDKNIEGEFGVRFDNRSRVVHLPVDADPTFALTNFRYDPRTKRFSALLLAPAETPRIRIPLSGRVIQMMKIPVLARRMSRGDIITDADIEWIDIDASRVNRNTIVDAKNLKGLTPRRRLSAGKVLRLGDLQRPTLIKKGALVNLMVRTPYMMLTVQGMAMDKGGKGDTVRVRNTRTKKIVHGVVAGPNIVLVEPMGHIALR